MRIDEVTDSTYVATSKISGAGRGLFASRPIQSGELITIGPIVHISDSDWELIKKTKFVRMMGLQWVNNQHVIPVGNIEYRLSREDAILFAKTERWRYSRGTGIIYISPFLLANHSDSPNCEEVIDISSNTVGLRALTFIDSGEEIVKRYNRVPTAKTSTLNWDI